MRSSKARRPTVPANGSRRSLTPGYFWLSPRRRLAVRGHPALFGPLGRDGAVVERLRALHHLVDVEEQFRLRNVAEGPIHLLDHDLSRAQQHRMRIAQE